jgi:hypothetical protein
VPPAVASEEMVTQSAKAPSLAPVAGVTRGSVGNQTA